MKVERKPFPSESFSKLANAEASHWWFCSRNRIILWALNRFVPKFNDFLEIGCGTGFVLEGISREYQDIKLMGAEYFEEGLIHARERIPYATFLQLDARVMDDAECHDVIGIFDVIEHIEEDELVLSNIAKGLRRGGSLLLTVPQHRWLWSTVDVQACHVRRYNRKELVNKVTRTGLTVEYVSSFVSFLVPLMWLARLRAKNNDYDPMSEFAIASWLNRLLEAVMTIETWLMKRGVTFPLGGSLLLVAKKYDY